MIPSWLYITIIIDISKTNIYNRNISSSNVNAASILAPNDPEKP